MKLFYWYRYSFLILQSQGSKGPSKLNNISAQLYRSPVDDLTERDDAEPKEKAKEPAKGRDKVNRALRDAAFHTWIRRKTSWNWKGLQFFHSPTQHGFLSKEDVQHGKVLLPGVVGRGQILPLQIIYLDDMTWARKSPLEPSSARSQSVSSFWGCWCSWCNLEHFQNTSLPPNERSQRQILIVYLDPTSANQSLGNGPLSNVQRGSMLKFRESQDLAKYPYLDFVKLTWARLRLLSIGILWRHIQEGSHTCYPPWPLCWWRGQFWQCCGNEQDDSDI